MGVIHILFQSIYSNSTFHSISLYHSQISCMLSYLLVDLLQFFACASISSLRTLMTFSNSRKSDLSLRSWLSTRLSFSEPGSQWNSLFRLLKSCQCCSTSFLSYSCFNIVQIAYQYFQENVILLFLILFDWLSRKIQGKRFLYLVEWPPCI